VRPAISVAAINDAHALIIGNSAYAGSNRLANPGNDARAMRAEVVGPALIAPMIR